MSNADVTYDSDEQVMNLIAMQELQKVYAIVEMLYCSRMTQSAHDQNLSLQKLNV